MTAKYQVTFDESVSWRIHWLMCDLWELKRDIIKAPTVSRVSDLFTGSFASLMARMKKVAAAYVRLRWEIQTMVGEDYAHDIDPYFKAIPKDAEYHAVMEDIKAIMKIIADKALQRETEYLRDSIAEIGKGPYY